MHFAEENKHIQNLFTAYDDESVTVNGQKIHYQQQGRGVIVSPRQLITDWSAHNLASLTATDLDEIYTLKPEIILLGTGATQQFPNTTLLKYLVSQQIGYEIMNTPAVCRTYNILANEGRLVVAALVLDNG